MDSTRGAAAELLPLPLLPLLPSFGTIRQRRAAAAAAVGAGARAAAAAVVVEGARCSCRDK
jgi:hypothetical protein